MSRLESWIFAGIVAVMLSVCSYLVVSLAETAAKIAVGLIAAGGAVFAAVVKHGFDLERERRSAEYTAKQKNYSELLATVGSFARKKEGAYDALCSAHLASWAFGDRGVILATNVLLGDPSIPALTRLLCEVRKSLGDRDASIAMLNTHSMSRQLASEPTYRPDILFPPRTSDGFKQ